MRPSPWRPRSGDVRGAGRLRPAEVRPRPRSRRRAPPTGRCGRCRRLNPYFPGARGACACSHGRLGAWPPLLAPTRKARVSGGSENPEVQPRWVLLGPGPATPVMGRRPCGSQLRSKVLGLEASVGEGPAGVRGPSQTRRVGRVTARVTVQRCQHAGSHTPSPGAPPGAGPPTAVHLQRGATAPGPRGARPGSLLSRVRLCRSASEGHAASLVPSPGLRACRPRQGARIPARLPCVLRRVRRGWRKMRGPRGWIPFLEEPARQGGARKRPRAGEADRAHHGLRAGALGTHVATPSVQRATGRLLVCIRRCPLNAGQALRTCREGPCPWGSGPSRRAGGWGPPRVRPSPPAGVGSVQASGRALLFVRSCRAAAGQDVRPSRLGCLGAWPALEGRAGDSDTGRRGPLPPASLLASCSSRA